MNINAMFAYNMHSQGGAELATALSIPRIRHTGSKFKPTPGKALINWGAGSDRFPSSYLGCTVLNNPQAVDVSVDKIRAFRVLQEAGVSIPPFTANKAEAMQWIEDGHKVFARTLLKAHSGRGIHIMYPEHPETHEVTAPLYVMYIKKKDEYRVHVLRGGVIDIQRKGLRAEYQGQADVNFLVRNLANGFTYVRNDNAGVALLNSASVPQTVKNVAVQAVAALGLDFGAADVIFNQQSKTAYVLEVNTAPGLEGTTVTNYAAAFAAL